jgi:hypothetical protein
MNRSPASARIARNEVRRFAPPLQLSAVHGVLWVTVDGEPEDIVLEAGESRRFDGRRPVLAMALGGPARLRALPTVPAARGWRWPWQTAGAGEAPA